MAGMEEYKTGSEGRGLFIAISSDR